MTLTKQRILLLFAFFLLTASVVHASTVWNDTMETGTALGNNWSRYNYTSGGSDYLGNTSTQSLLYDPVGFPNGAVPSFVQAADDTVHTNYNATMHVKITRNAAIVGFMGWGNGDTGGTCLDAGHGYCFFISELSDTQVRSTYGGANFVLKNFLNNTWESYRAEVVGDSVSLYINETFIETHTLVNSGTAISNRIFIGNTTPTSGFTVQFDNWQICTGVCDSLTPTPPPVASVNYSLTVHANDTVNNTLVQSFTVNLNGTNSKSTTNGTIIYTQLNNGSYNIEFTATGYNATNQTTSIAGNTTTTLSVSPTPPSPPAVNYTLTLTANDTVNNTLLTTFTLTLDGAHTTSTTNGTVYYHTTNGTHSIGFTSTGYNVATISVNVAGDTAKLLSVTPSTNTTHGVSTQNITGAAAVYIIMMVLGTFLFGSDNEIRNQYFGVVSAIFALVFLIILLL